MAESDSESKLDEMERSNLQKIISEVEGALAGSTSASRGIFENFLQNARGRIGALDKKIKDAEKERETHSRDQVVIAQMAESEKALNAQEQKTFGGFLEKEFFTKKDFGALESFYAKTWDRLNNGGKNELSYRIWEGVRRDEYKFSELPNSVREKETKQAYMRLRDSTIGDIDAARIPEKDRQDFIRAYEGGNRQEAGKVLDRDSFKENMFRGRESATREHSKVGQDRPQDKANVAREMRDASADKNAGRTPDSANSADLDLGRLNLDGVKLTEAKAPGSSADIPNAKVADSATRQSTRGG